MRRADAVCAAYDRQTTPIANPRSYDAVIAWGRRTLPIYAAALQQLEALRPPRSDEAAVHAWLAADKRVERAIRELVRGARNRDFPTVTAAASQAQLAGSASRAAAASLGMSVCGTFVTGR